MDVFDVRDQLIEDYRAFTTAVVEIDDAHIRQHVADQLDRGEQWPHRVERRAELDAMMFHVYGVPGDDAEYIIETLPIWKVKDIAAHGEYRTKRLILEAYDRIDHATAE